MQRTVAAVIGTLLVIVLGAVVFPLLVNDRSGGTPSSPSPSMSAPALSPSASVVADLLDRRWTVLFVGTDLNDRREQEGQGPNTDALMLASLSADGSELTLVSLPRDTVDVPLEDGSTYEGKINGLYNARGIESLVGAMETLYGVPIDGYVLLDMEDVGLMIDAVGGVEVNPEEALTDPIVNLDLEPGPQLLDANQAMGYVRTRVDQDYGRMGRQQEVIVELARRLTDPGTEIDLATLIEGLESLDTDLPLDQLATLIELARRATEANVETVVIQPPLITFEGDRDDGRGYVLEPDVEAIRGEVQSLISD